MPFRHFFSKDTSYCVALAAYLVMTLRFDKFCCPISWIFSTKQTGNISMQNILTLHQMPNENWKCHMTLNKIQISSQHNRHNYSLMKKKWLFWTVANSFIHCLSDIHFSILQLQIYRAGNITSDSYFLR